MSVQRVTLPVLALLISGGHTELVLMKKWLQYELIGQTRDDAVGEAFDKVARMLGLPYPGGPEISKLAEQARAAYDQTAGFGSESRTGLPVTRLPDLGLGTGSPVLRLPRPMIDSNTCDFSFAGLKTAVLYLLKEREKTTMIYHSESKLTEQEKMHIAHEFENAVAEVLWKKTALAIQKTRPKTIVLGGGVSANTHIRRVFKEKMASDFPATSLQIPASSLSTDNAIMIALAGYYRALRREFVTEITADGNLSLCPKNS